MPGRALALDGGPGGRDGRPGGSLAGWTGATALPPLHSRMLRDSPSDPASGPSPSTPAGAPALAPPGAGRAALVFIFITVTIDLLAFGIIIPVLPHLVRELAGGSLPEASRWNGVFGTAFALTQFISSPIQGALSDRYGRRVVILISCLGLGLDFAVMALAASIPVLLAGRIVSGITAASFSTANAYIADVTPPERRAAAFGMLGAAFGIGFVVGPALGSLLSSLDVRAPFWGAAALALCNFLYGLLVLPESLPPERRSPRFDWSRANPLGALLALRRYPQVVGLALVAFLFNVAHYVLPSTFVLYADARYGWGPSMVGWVMAASGACGAVVQAGLAGRVVARLGERRTLLLAAAFGALGFAWYGLAPSGGWFLAGVPVLALWGLGSPAVQSLMSRQVDPREQGRLQGAVTGLTSAAGIFAPFVFASLFAAAVEPGARLALPGVGFLLAAGLVAAGGLAGARATRPRHA